MVVNTRITPKHPDFTTPVRHISFTRSLYCITRHCTGRQPIGLDVFLGSIAQLTNGDMKKASLVDIGEQTNPSVVL